jgi:hypothetical protein
MGSVLKGHGFSRAVGAVEENAALAAEEKHIIVETKFLRG